MAVPVALCTTITTTTTTAIIITTTTTFTTTITTTTTTTTTTLIATIAITINSITIIYKQQTNTLSTKGVLAHSSEPEAKV